MKHHNCDICGSTDSEPLTQFPACHVCQECGFLYVPERRTHEEIIDDWKAVYRGKGYDPGLPAIQARLRYVALSVLSVADIDDRRTCRVLDYGGGKGDFLDIMAIPDCVTYDPATTADFKVDGFDVVTINWALENSVDCNQMLRDASSHLRDYGMMFVATGSRVLVHPRKPLSDYFSDIAAPDLHCFRFSVNSLSNVLAKNGLLPFFVNRYYDHDVLLVGAIKTPEAHKRPLVRDDPAAVQEFFNTWYALDENLNRLSARTRLAEPLSLSGNMLRGNGSVSPSAG